MAGDDGVAHVVLERLRTRLGGRCLAVELLSVSEPSQLVELLCHPGPVWIVDAVVGAGDPGTVLELSPDELLAVAACSLSSHGLNAAQAIELCRSLYPERVSPVLCVLAVAIETPHRYRSGLSPEVHDAALRCVERLVRAVRGGGRNP